MPVLPGVSVPVPGVLLHVLLDHGELVGGHDGLQEVPGIILCGMEPDAFITISLRLSFGLNALDYFYKAEQVKVHPNGVSSDICSTCGWIPLEDLWRGVASSSLEGLGQSMEGLVE